MSSDPSQPHQPSTPAYPVQADSKMTEGGRSSNSVGQGWSAANPIPTVQGFIASQTLAHKSSTGVEEEELQAEEEKEREVEEQEKHQGENKQEIMDRMKPGEDKPTDKVKETKGTHTVRDPTTMKPVTIKDASFDDFTNSGHTPEAQLQPPPPASAVRASKIGPNPASPSNVLLQNFPPPRAPELQPILDKLNILAIFSVFASFIVWIFTAFRHGWIAFFFRSALLSSVGFVGASLAWAAGRFLEKEIDSVRYAMHRERGEKFSPPMPESVEWLNAFISTFWGLVNPDMFLSTADMIEDIMQQSLPGFVDAVRISDIGQGINPIRILSMRALPDRPQDRHYPRVDWIDKGKEPEPRQVDVGATDPSKAAPDNEQTGDYVNFEVAFAYHAQPGHGSKVRSKNIHLLLEFFIGMYDWLHIPVPLWVQVESIAGTVRLRIQFISEPPFIRNVTFTLMGVPAVEVSVIPLLSALPNILDLPLVSTFVKMAIKAGTAEFVAPKSMTLNMQEMLSGAAIGDLQALGVFLVTIHHAENLSAQDSNGKSDPYVVAAYAKFGKPLYSSRIILGDLNPVWEETFALIITADEVKANESLSLMLWDSDAFSDDDLCGRIRVPVKDLMKHPNQMNRRSDKLMGFEDADAMQGTLTWSVGFFEKAPLVKALEIPEEHPSTVSTKTLPEMEMRPHDKAPNPAAKDLPPAKADGTRTRPDPRWKSGVLSVVIHQVNGLERRNLKGTSGKDREGQAGQDTDEASEQVDNLPSSYCEMIINDDMVYKTRVKQYSSMPYFEAGTETFIRDWEETVVRIVVRDAALREKDPILGIVSLKLKDVFKESSEVTGLFSIEEGIGFGRVNLSLLFKGVKTELPQNLRGWETSTVELNEPIKLSIDSKRSDIIKSAKRLVISTSDSTQVLPTKEAEINLDAGEALWEIEQLRLPVYSRFQSVLTFELHGGLAEKAFNAVPLVGDKQPIAIAVLWLQELVDDEERVVRIPLIVSKDLKQLRQNYLNEVTKKTHDYEIVGWLTTKIKLDKGLDQDHEAHAASQARRHAFETYDHIEGQAEVAEQNSHAMDDGVIDKEEARAIKVAQKRQDINRQRGLASHKGFRTYRWAKEGLIKRIPGTGHKTNKSEKTVQSEGAS